MAFSLVPEHLRKPELVFEVLARGQKPEGDVRALRAQLRACIALDRSWNAEFQINTEFEFCKTRMEELEDDINFESLPMSGSAKARLASQLLHWRDRIVLLMSAPSLNSDIKSWAFSASNKLKQALDGLSEVRSVKEKGVLFTAVTPTEVPTTITFANHPPALSFEPPRVTMSPMGSGPPEAAGEASSIVVPSFSSFGKLPHPLGSVLQHFPRVDGLDTNLLIHFLLEVFKLREFPGMTDAMLMQILAQFSLRPLFDRLLDCLKRGATFDQFHAEILEFFVPARVRERLRVERVYRPQAPDETLSHFVGEIRDVARVLRLSLSETELVSLILEGIKPEERSRLIFCSRPASFADLDRLSIISRGVQDADDQREAISCAKNSFFKERSYKRFLAKVMVMCCNVINTAQRGGVLSVNMPLITTVDNSMVDGDVT
ncbi:hypothetical protein J6590_022384 [Homalodisca vitripennis]|nr:hypothetical protein J6590_022384 [Homalodisca vitripennis]